MALGGMYTTSQMRAKALADDLLNKLRQGGLVPACSTHTS